MSYIAYVPNHNNNPKKETAPEILKVSSLGVLYGNQGTQWRLDDFLNYYEKNIKYNNCSIIYNEKDVNFTVIDEGEKYILELSAEEKKNFVEGKYNYYTSKLKQFADIKSKAAKNKEAIKKIIKDGDNDILPNDEAKEIYLEELKKRLKKLPKERFKEAFSDMLDIESGGFDWSAGAHFILLVVRMVVSFLVFGFGGLMVGGIFADLSPALSRIIVLSIATAGTLFVPIKYFFAYYLEPLKDMLTSKRILKYKIKSLENSLKYKQTKSISLQAFDNSLSEPLKSYSYNFKDTIFRSLSELLDRIDYIKNSDDAKRLKKEVKSILDEYRKRLSTLDGVNPIDSLNGQNIVDLQNDMVKRITNLETELNEVRSKDISREELLEEGSMLDKRLDGVLLDSSEIEGVIREREKNRAPIRTRKRAQ